jgi:hypothetical protein
LKPQKEKKFFLNTFYNNNLSAFGIPLIYAFALRGIFLNDFYDTIVGVVSIAFLIFGPLSIGALTIALTPQKTAVNVWYAMFAPWLVIIVFLALTFVIKFEGAICLVMALPIFLIFASVGGLLTSFIRKRKLNNTINIAAAALLPFLIIPLEGSLNITPVTYEAYTTIKIHAPKEEIWQNVTRVRTINESEDNGKLSKLMGFPRPVVAELDTLMAGGRRRAVFDKGLVFDEVVYDYTHEKKMSFNITPLTSEIPPATLDEHVTVGGKYFTVLDGTYELLPAENGMYELVLYSHFNMNTSFNFYSGMWAKWIMKDIQNNILDIIKKRCEN